MLPGDLEADREVHVEWSAGFVDANKVELTEGQNVSQSNVASQETVSDNQCGKQEMGASVVHN